MFDQTLKAANTFTLPAKFFFFFFKKKSLNSGLTKTEGSKLKC